MDKLNDTSAIRFRGGEMCTLPIPHSSPFSMRAVRPTPANDHLPPDLTRTCQTSRAYAFQIKRTGEASKFMEQNVSYETEHEGERQLATYLPVTGANIDEAIGSGSNTWFICDGGEGEH